MANKKSLALTKEQYEKLIEAMRSGGTSGQMIALQLHWYWKQTSDCELVTF